MIENLQKKRGENKKLTKDINNMRTVINTSAPSLEEEGTKIIEDLKRQMVLMEEENIKLFMKKIYFIKYFRKAFQNSKGLRKGVTNLTVRNQSSGMSIQL